VIVDLSTPRLDSALEGRPDVVKLNDWELAEYLAAPVDGPRLRAGAELLLERGAGAAVVTRGAEPALAVTRDRAWTIVPPRLERGYREGCGDSMLGAMAAVLSEGRDLEAAGFTDIGIETTAESSRAPSAHIVAAAYCQGTVLRSEIEARAPGTLQAVTDAVTAALAARHGPGEISAAIQAHVITAA